MRSFNQFINENQDKKPVSRESIKGLLLNTYNTAARKFLESMLNRDKDQLMIEFSREQYKTLKLIKTYGKIDSSLFNSKN